MADKRPRDDGDSTALVSTKRSRPDGTGNSGAIMISSGPPGAMKRTSSLKAPIMLLTGHEGEVFSTQFSPDGQSVASASFDRQIYLWNTQDECKNYAALLGHAGAILEVHWTPDGEKLISASTDKTAAVWDAFSGTRIRRFRGHSSFVNSCCPAKDEPYVVTGSDDGTIKIWDQRRRRFVNSLANKYQVTSVCYGQTSETIITAGLDNVVKVWDTRNLSVLHEMKGHTDTITGLRLSPDGNFVLSNAMDNTVRIWDIRPYAKQRLVNQFVGAQHGFEKNLIKCAWTPDGKHIGCGSADRNVYIWNVATQEIKYKLPGHTGSVNAVDFHPAEPIIVSASSDRKLYMGELVL